jgi:hypothetical protein
MTFEDAAPENPRAVAGDNAPPPLTLKDRLKADYAARVVELNALVAHANDAPKTVGSDADDLAVSAVVVEAGKLWKVLDAERTREKRPHLDANADIDNFFSAFLTRADRIKVVLTQRVTDYKNAKIEAARRAAAETARLAREESSRLLAEAAAAEKSAGPKTDAPALGLFQAEAAELKAQTFDDRAAAPASELGRTRGIDVASSAKIEWLYEITDLDGVDLAALRAFIPRADIDKFIKAYVRINKGDKPLAGVRIYSSAKALIRGA